MGSLEIKQKLGCLIQCGRPGVKLWQISMNQGAKVETTSNCHKTLNQEYFYSAKNSCSPVCYAMPTRKFPHKRAVYSL